MFSEGNINHIGNFFFYRVTEKKEKKERLNPCGRVCVSVAASLDLVEKLQILFSTQSVFGVDDVAVSTDLLGGSE